MRREGYIIEEIIEYSNMSEAFDSVLRGTDRKRSRQGRFLLAHREKIITELTASIADGSFRLGGYHEREIEEYGKKRILQILSMKDRIAVFAIMNVVDRHLQKRYIRTTGASIKRRGTHDLMNCIRTDLQKIRKARFTHTNLTSGGFMTMRGRTLLCGASGGCSRTKGCWSCWSGLLSCCQKVSVSDCAVHKGQEICFCLYF